MDGLYLAGEPLTNLDESLVIGFERHPDIVTGWFDPGYDRDKVEYYIDSYPIFKVT